MKKIFVVGAGLSTSSLIKYLLDKSEKYNWQVLVGDMSEELANSKIQGHPNGKAIKFDVNDVELKEKLIKESDIVVSMLPARMHYLVAKTCVDFGKHMVTASYVSDDVKSLDKEAKEKGVLLLNEIGVDPGIDHMSAMQVLDRVREDGGEIVEFESNTGGLVAPKYDNNPWNYKFTWNPRNVILAGQGASQFLHNGRYKYIPYHKLFERTERIHVLDLGEFEAYPNRDSLKYRETYGLNDVKTMFRGTIRRPGFSRAWNVFVQLGLTDDTYIYEDSENHTYRDFINSFMKYTLNKDVENKIAEYLNINPDSATMYKVRWTDIFKKEKIGLKNASPAKILQHLLEKKWSMDEDDKDMIVMQHQVAYINKEGQRRRIIASMVTYGKDRTHTAMSITVGIPVAIAVKLILTGKITSTGVQIPIKKDIYEPVLEELKEYDIYFVEEECECEKDRESV